MNVFVEESKDLLDPLDAVTLVVVLDTTECLEMYSFANTTLANAPARMPKVFVDINKQFTAEAREILAFWAHNCTNATQVRAPNLWDSLSIQEKEVAALSIALPFVRTPFIVTISVRFRLFHPGYWPDVVEWHSTTGSAVIGLYGDIQRSKSSMCDFFTTEFVNQWVSRLDATLIVNTEASALIDNCLNTDAYDVAYAAGFPVEDSFPLHLYGSDDQL